DDVDAAEVIEGCLDDLVAVLDRVVVRRRLATGLFDLRHDPIGCRRALAAAVDPASEIVDDDARAAAREQQRVAAAETVGGAGDNRDLTVETKLVGHWGPRANISHTN